MSTRLKAHCCHASVDNMEQRRPFDYFKLESKVKVRLRQMLYTNNFKQMQTIHNYQLLCYHLPDCSLPQQWQALESARFSWILSKGTPPSFSCRLMKTVQP